MATPNIEKQIQDRLEGFVNELSGLVRLAALEAVQEALGAGSVPKRRGRPSKTNKARAPRKVAKRTAKKAAKRVKRSNAEVEADAGKILAHVKANPGVGVAEMKSALRMSPKDMRLPILQLLAQKKLKATGRRRGMKYHAAGRGAPTKKRTTKKGTTKKRATKKRATKKSASKKRTAKKPARRKTKRAGTKSRSKK